MKPHTVAAMTDGDLWRNGRPIRGRTSHPVLFDRNGQPKPAFDAALKTAIRNVE